MLSALVVSVMMMSLSARNQKVIDLTLDRPFVAENFTSNGVTSKSNLYVAILGLEGDNFIQCYETMSLEDYAWFVENNIIQGVLEQYPAAAFALLRYDPLSRKLCATDPSSEIEYLKKIDPDWYDKEVRLSNILEKSAIIFLKACEVVLLSACWTTSYVIIPGSKYTYRQSVKAVKWAQMKLNDHHSSKKWDNSFLSKI